MTRYRSAFSIERAWTFRVACRRGTAVTELAMVAPIIVVFMTLAWGLWRLTIAEHDALMQADVATSRKSVRFLSMGEILSPPDYVDSSRTPEVIEVPVLPGVSEPTLRDYASLPNMSAHAGGSVYMEQVTEISADFGGFNLARDGMIVRPSWTFNGFPMVNSQHPEERDEIRRWYDAAQDATLPRDLRDRLGLNE